MYSRPIIKEKLAKQFRLGIKDVKKGKVYPIAVFFN